jgi:hypothetical protein
MMDGGSGWKFTFASCAFPASNDTVASPVCDRHAVNKVLAAHAH